MPYFPFEGHQLAYTEHGHGPRPFVLLHGQLLSQSMQLPLANALAERGNRVITLDLLGHGQSERPREVSRYSMGQFAEQVIGLLDHLDLAQAVVGGTSLGANVTLELAVLAPERARGLVIEMPVLDHGVYGAVIAFTPLLTMLKYGLPVIDVMSRVARFIPDNRLPPLGKIVVEAVAQDHRASADVLQGLFLGRIAPNRRLRTQISSPTLVIGHPGDPVHPLGDAEMLAGELRAARLVQAQSIYELRLHPERLTNEIAAFLDDCWKPQAVARRGRRRQPAPRVDAV